MASSACTFSRLTILFMIICLPLTSSIDFNYPAAFNFGDSNSDTGNLVAGLGAELDPPNGQTYFHKPSGRSCDGRLLIDFLMDAMHLPYLNPYLESIGAPILRNGCNFAVAGSTIRSAFASSMNPFSFRIQVAQFLRFKAKVEHLQAKSRKSDKYIPDQDYFGKALYIFDIGQNDILGGFYFNTSDQIIAGIPLILSEFEDGIEIISMFGTNSSTLDGLGCVNSHNQVAKKYNLQLHALFKKLQGKYQDANVTYVDIFTIKSNLIANYSTYGFEQPLMACCGYGGPPLNYDSRIACGQTTVLDGSLVTAKGLNDSTKYVNWDGSHYTEAANQPFSFRIQVAQFLRFKAKVEHLQAKSRKSDKYIPDQDYFGKALYIFDIGQNDILGGFYFNTSDQIIAGIPLILSEFEDEIIRPWSKKFLDTQHWSLRLLTSDYLDVWNQFINTRRAWIHFRSGFKWLSFSDSRPKLNICKLNSLNSSMNPFSFRIQVAQFLRFKAKVEHLQAKSRKSDKYIPDQDYFGKALYIFDIGQNDILGGFYFNTSDQIIAGIPLILSEFEDGIEVRFEQPLMACCGYGGPPLNYDSRIARGQTIVLDGSLVTAKGLNDSTKYVNWDGSHYTEAANQYVASEIVTGKGFLQVNSL
ncbi:hypothetical protein RD792_016740 [Penstemon davidsonii]|uniref:Uncharacterized protein n=1 Tax=Penstemon davidsonii TaxID=160366 RepID=A0ABR0CK58_9LAMI|nr:hypothetical protein RD792_016740 [Penstemon davidsonii]